MRILAKAAWLAVAAALCVQPARSQTPLRGAIEGDVVDASTGRGISGARVRIQSGQDDPMFTSTDEQGHFQFAGLEFKSYQLDARYPGFISPRGADESRVACVQLVGFELQPGELEVPLLVGGGEHRIVLAGLDTHARAGDPPPRGCIDDVSFDGAS